MFTASYTALYRWRSLRNKHSHWLCNTGSPRGREGSFALNGTFAAAIMLALAASATRTSWVVYVLIDRCSMAEGSHRVLCHYLIGCFFLIIEDCTFFPIRKLLQLVERKERGLPVRLESRVPNQVRSWWNLQRSPRQNHPPKILSNLLTTVSQTSKSSLVCIYRYIFLFLHHTV